MSTKSHIKRSRMLHIPVPPVSDGLVVSDAVVAGEEVWMLPLDHFQIISAAHFHLFRLLLKQDLAAQLVKHNGVHLWPDMSTISSKIKKGKQKSPLVCHSVPVSLLWNKSGYFTNEV